MKAPPWIEVALLSLEVVLSLQWHLDGQCKFGVHLNVTQGFPEKHCWFLMFWLTTHNKACIYLRTKLARLDACFSLHGGKVCVSTLVVIKLFPHETLHSKVCGQWVTNAAKRFCCWPFQSIYFATFSTMVECNLVLLYLRDSRYFCSPYFQYCLTTAF